MRCDAQRRDSKGESEDEGEGEGEGESAGEGDLGLVEAAYPSGLADSSKRARQKRFQKDGGSGAHWLLQHGGPSRIAARLGAVGRCTFLCAVPGAAWLHTGDSGSL